MFYRIGFHITQCTKLFTSLFFNNLKGWYCFQNSPDDSDTYCEKHVGLSSVQSSTKHWPLLSSPTSSSHNLHSSSTHGPGNCLQSGYEGRFRSCSGESFETVSATWISFVTQYSQCTQFESYTLWELKRTLSTQKFSSH